jgi:hypothetical protein
LNFTLRRYRGDAGVEEMRALLSAELMMMQRVVVNSW